jgi:hypothetical protein
MKKSVLVFAAVLVLLPASIPVMAHHAFSAEFDANKQVNLRGSVTKMDWTNPHAWLHINVREADGSITAWMIELGPPNILIRRGWNMDSVPVGLEIVVVGYQAKDGAKRANGRDITLPDGRKFFAGSPGTGAPQ